MEIIAPNISGGDYPFSLKNGFLDFFLFPTFSVGVTQISVKTGEKSNAGTDAVADIEICDGLGDGLGKCCRTSWLNNHGNDRIKYTQYTQIASENE